MMIGDIKSSFMTSRWGRGRKISHCLHSLYLYIYLAHIQGRSQGEANGVAAPLGKNAALPEIIGYTPKSVKN